MRSNKEIAKDFIEKQFSKEMMHRINNDFPKANELIDYVIGKAWKDATPYERKISGSKIIEKRNKISEFLSSEIKKLDDCNDYRNWYKEVLENLSEEYLGKNYGVAQKLLNMSVKYVYFLEIGYEKQLFSGGSIRRFEDDFDVPIDRFMLNWFLYNALGDEEVANKVGIITCWNKIEYKTYLFLQPKIKDLLKRKYDRPILISETEVWSSINKFDYLKK